MDFSQTQYLQKRKRPSSPKKVATKRLAPDQVRLLERTFASHKKLDPDRKLHLAAELGVPPRQVAIWYQNRRSRWRTQTLELDKGALQLKLDDALAEKRRLEQDVASLRQELDRAREMLDAATAAAGGDGGGHSESSKSAAAPEVPMSCAFGEDDVNWCDWEDRGNRVLRMEDGDDDALYACWMLTNNGSRLD